MIRSQSAPPQHLVESSVLSFCLNALGKLAAAEIWFATQLGSRPGLWLDLGGDPLTEAE